jgi:gluconolactonase
MGNVQQVGAPQGSFFSFLEGPMWVGSANRLFFSDNVSPERIFVTQAPFTSTTLFMSNSGSNGLAVDNQDQLLVADQAANRVTRINPASNPGSATVAGVLVPAGGVRPNDLVMRSDNNLYFTEPSSGFYRQSPSGQITGPIRQNGQTAPQAPNSPNGIVLTPDENFLYVGDVNQSFVSKFPLLADGTVDTANGTRFTSTQSGTVDGMAVDCAGNLYVGTSNGVEVYSPTAQRLGVVPTGYSSNATFGGADRRTLFVTSQNTLKFVTLAVPGLPN